MGGMVYSPRTESGQEVDLAPVDDQAKAEGGFRDEMTGSHFTLDGRGVSGSASCDRGGSKRPGHPIVPAHPNQWRPGRRAPKRDRVVDGEPGRGV